MVRFPSDTGCKDGARLLFPQPHAPLSPAQGWGGRAFPELLASPNLLPAGRVHAPARSRPLAERGKRFKGEDRMPRPSEEVTTQSVHAARRSVLLEVAWE